MEGQGRSFPITRLTFQVRKVIVGEVVGILPLLKFRSVIVCSAVMRHARRRIVVKVKKFSIPAPTEVASVRAISNLSKIWSMRSPGLA